MSNNNQIPVIKNMPMQSNPMNPINRMNPMNLVLLNNNLANLSLQNNIQMYPDFLSCKLKFSIENLDVYTFQNILNEFQLPNKTKNSLLNQIILLYLTKFSQFKAQCAYKQMISILLKLKANPNLCLRYNSNNPNNDRNYAIFSIVEKNDIELVKIFLDNNADINVTDNQGRNCLFYLMTVPNNNNNLIDRRPLCSSLLGRGININYLDHNGISPIMESINKGYIYIMNMLIKYCGDVNLVNFNDGNTALHYAIINRNHEALYTLLSKGNCDITIKNKNNESPLDLAEQINNESFKDIYTILMKYASTGKDKENNCDNENEDSSTSNNCKSKKDKKQHDNNGGDSDKMFVFPKDDITSRVEIPFAFQNNNPILNFNDSDSSSSNTTGNNGINNFNQFYSFIKIQNTPTLYLDISDETNQEKLICDCLKTENVNLEKTLEKKENKLQNFITENELLQKELMKLKQELISKNTEIKSLTEQMQQEDHNHKKQRQMNQNQLEQNDIAIQNLLSKYKSLENTLKKENAPIIETNQNEIKTETETKSETSQNDNNKMQYYEKKFNDEKYNDNDVVNLMTTDLYDLYHYNKMIYDSKIPEINKMINILKEIIDINVDIKLYGSYATQTSMIWSEVDLLIIPNIDPNSINENFYISFIQNTFHKLKNSFFTQKVVILEDTQIITPIIKLETNDKNNNLIYNIYVLDNTNYEDDPKNLDDNSLLNSVIMTNEYNKKYKGNFIPLLLGLKQLLYNTNLISSYCNTHNEININSYNGGISSYALSVMLMSFLDQYKCGAYDICLGQIFIDFLKIHGYLMYENNNRKIISIDYNNSIEEKNENYFENSNLDSLIIIDPFNSRNNLCEKMNNYSYSYIKLALMIAYCILKDNCECSCHYDESICYEGKNHCILNKIFKTIKRFTSVRKNH